MKLRQTRSVERAFWIVPGEPGQIEKRFEIRFTESLKLDRAEFEGWQVLCVIKRTDVRVVRVRLPEGFIDGLCRYHYIADISLAPLSL
ncbi:protein of unknown function [Pseudomonas sp. JV551A1]|nr:protein of unknown function [Pseudomonas sp. JV551A1]